VTGMYSNQAELPDQIKCMQIYIAISNTQTSN
jgi:hypothetical protein